MDFFVKCYKNKTILNTHSVCGSTELLGQSGEFFIHWAPLEQKSLGFLDFRILLDHDFFLFSSYTWIEIYVKVCD